jgi:hypothetical protein
MLRRVFSFQLSTLILQFIGFGTSIFLARYLDLNDRGMLAEKILYIGMAMSVSFSGVTEYVLDCFRNAKLTGYLLLFVYSISFFWIILYFLSAYFKLSFSLNSFFFVIYFFYFVSNVLSIVFWYNGEKSFIFIWRLLAIISNPLGLIFCYVFDMLNADTMLVSAFLAPLLASFFMLSQKKYIYLFVTKKDFFAGIDVKKFIIHFLSTLFLIIIFNIDKVFFSKIVEKKEFALYTIAAAVFSPLLEVISSASIVIMNEAKGRVAISYNIQVLILNIVILLIFHFFVLDLIPFIFGSKYFNSVSIAKELTVLYFFIVVFKINDVFLRIEKALFSLISNLILLFLLLGIIIIYFNYFVFSMNTIIVLFSLSFAVAVIYQYIVLFNLKN